jgi:Na+-translocating ferredoxin:NAD+ oxidoreductase RnfC subunit
VDWFRYGKGELRKLTRDSAASELARRRFEDREARLQRLQQERAEKMTRRKQMLQDKTTQQDRIRASIQRAGHKGAGKPGGQIDPRADGTSDDT